MNNIKIYRSASQTITVKDLVGAFNKEMAPIDVFSLWNFAKSRWQRCSGLVWRRHHLNADNCSSGWRRLFVWFIPSSAQLTALQLLARELSQYNSISRSVPAFQHTPQLPSEKIRWPWRKKYLYFLTTCIAFVGWFPIDRSSLSNAINDTFTSFLYLRYLGFICSPVYF